jgi:multicomponent Na+:H+ antiporter subunit D
VNEVVLHGRGRRLKATGVVFTLAGLGLAGLPPFATYLGTGWISDGAAGRAAGWVTAIMILCTILSGGAVLRVAGGVFYGLGDPPGEDPEMAKEAAEETSETDAGKRRTPLTMIVPAAALTAAAFAIGLIAGLGQAAEAAAVRFTDQAGYIATVLHGAHPTYPPGIHAGVTVTSVLAGLGSAAGALLLAWTGLYRRRLPVLRGHRPSRRAAALARGFQSGVINDYVTWLVLGLACLGGVFALIVG